MGQKMILWLAKFNKWNIKVNMCQKEGEKRMKKNVCSLLLMISILISNLFPISVYASGLEEYKYYPNIEVHNGVGEQIYSLNLKTELEKKQLEIDKIDRTEIEPRGVGTWILTAATAYGIVSMVNDTCYLLTGLDPKVWIRENVIVPFYSSSKTMMLYSINGGITNPYPPNSSQYHEFKRTNFYWVVL